MLTFCLKKKLFSNLLKIDFWRYDIEVVDNKKMR